MVEGFEMLELIGSGGYSRVYRARQTGFDRTVAVKVLNIELESDSQQRAFERECRAMGVLSEHPNIVTVLTATSTNGIERKPCIVMELYAGGTLGDWVVANGPLDPQRLLAIGVQVCGALETAHSRGVVHRDLKPQNLFLSEYGQPALGDFGISSFEGDRTVTGGGGALTIHYAAPEVLEGESATAVSDVYSLAATLYFLASGQRPFPRSPDQSMTDVARRILLEPAPRLGTGLPSAFADLVQRAMAKRPGDRPASAFEFGRALQEVQLDAGLAVTTLPLAGQGFEPIGSVPASRSRSSSAVVPRSVRGWALAAAAIAVLGVGGAVVARSAAATRSDGEPDVAGTTGDSGSDQYFAVPARPGDVAVVVTDGIATVSWDPSPNAVAYQVERMDEAGDGQIVEVEGTFAELAIDSGERPCVSVTAIGAQGRQSQASPAVCADG